MTDEEDRWVKDDREKEQYRTWREIPERVLEYHHPDGVVENVAPRFEKRYAPQEKRGVRTLQIGFNLYHWWRDEVTKRFGEEAAEEIVMEIGKRWGQLTAEVLKGPPFYLDPEEAEENPDEFFEKYIEAAEYTSFPMCEQYEVHKVEGENKIIWQTKSCRQHIPWRDGFYIAGAELPPDPELDDRQCDQWWEYLGKGLSTDRAKIKFNRTSSMEEEGTCDRCKGFCEWEVWLELEE